jgi:solute carrier family 25 folate transporter 32
MAVRNPQGLSPLHRWTTQASESQFNALAGAVGGFTSGVVTCPLDVIKTKLQAQGGFLAVSKGRHVGHHKVYEGLLGTARVIWKEEGVRGLYRGLGPIILGYLPTWAVWFTVYNKSKVWMADHNSKSPWGSHVCRLQQTALFQEFLWSWVVRFLFTDRVLPSSA